jgi:hypothetical protein
VFEWHKRFKEAQEVRMKKSRVKRRVAAFSDAKCIIYHDSAAEKQTVDGKFCEVMIKRFIARVHRVRTEFQESGSWYHLDDSAPAHSSGVVPEFLAKRGIPVLFHPHYSPDLAPAHFYYFLN